MPVGQDSVLPRLAIAHLSGNWDSGNEKCRLNFILACGPETLEVVGRKYVANLKQCMVTLFTDKCTADFFGAYEYTLSLIALRPASPQATHLIATGAKEDSSALPLLWPSLAGCPESLVEFVSGYYATMRVG